MWYSKDKGVTNYIRAPFYDIRAKRSKSRSCLHDKTFELFFRCSSFLKMLPRCGRAAHICEANWILQLCFPAAIAFLKLSNSNKVVSWESRLQIQTRQRGNCSTLVGKSRGGTPFCRTRKTVFFRSIVSKYRAAGKQKVFCSSNFSKMLARCGRAAHICEANMILESGFPAAIACFEIVQFK